MIDREPITIKEKRQKYCEHIPAIYQATYRKAMKGRSLAAAVKAKCQDCMNWQQVEIRECPVVTCTLHPYRPYISRTSTRKSVSTQMHRQNGRFQKKRRPEGSLVG